MINRLILSATFSAAAACGSNTDQGAIPTDTTVVGGNSANTLPVENTTLGAVGLDGSALNRDVNPCDDFYEFACGGWLANTEIPSDKSRYGRFTQIHERNEATLHAVLEEARAGKLQSPVAAKLGAYYGTCMDEAAVEQAGISAIKPLLKIAGSVKNTKTLDKAIVDLQKDGIGVLFHLASTPDFIDATKMVGNLGQGGLGLPDRDYYLKDDERSKGIRKAYVEHVTAMFGLIGMSGKQAAKAASEVMDIETALAKATMSRVDQRDPENIYHKIDRAGVEKLVPSFDWGTYFSAMGVPDIQEITVDSEEFFAHLDSVRGDMKPAAWKSYLSWHVVHKTAALLPKVFVEENFKLDQTISGAKEIRPRWKRCVSSTDNALGEMLAQPYLERMFTPVAKEGADAMVQGITGAFGKVVHGIDWMSDETKTKALGKLGTISPMFGYPEQFKSYDWEIDTTNHAANAMTSRKFEKARDLAKIGKPYDRSEWFMSPQTTNAYYNPQANQMVFPAGILQPPFFSESAHVPVNLGAMGMIVGHELTHGFDDSGAKFDGDGNMNNWWAADDLKKFEERGECVVAQYESYKPLEDLHLNGKLTLGENIADIGGVKLAFMAYREMLANAEKQLVADGFTEDQQFFMAVGQAWCSRSREEVIRMLAVTDPHSPSNFRVLGALTNTPEFSEAFSCEKGSNMNPVDTCTVW
ncbi:MAG: M13 family metallopeptidase [Myxococcales bacterium]|nr:M13 family metallopeptidase [Myxococcales bacterium]